MTFPGIRVPNIRYLWRHDSWLEGFVLSQLGQALHRLSDGLALLLREAREAVLLGGASFRGGRNGEGLRGGGEALHFAGGEAADVIMALVRLDGAAATASFGLAVVSFLGLLHLDLLLIRYRIWF